MKREVTRLRSKACRWDDFRPRCRYFRAPPAIVRRGGGRFFFLSLSTAVSANSPPGHERSGRGDSRGEKLSVGVPNDSFYYQTSV